MSFKFAKCPSARQAKKIHATPTSDEIWFEANKKAIELFPDAIFLPGFWAEYGMCTEPSAFGAKCQWHEATLPYADKLMVDVLQVVSLPKPNVKTDGLLPFAINRLRNLEPRINNLGHEIKFAVARGPLNIASFLIGSAELMTAMVAYPQQYHKLIAMITDFLVEWLSYQKEVFPSIDGIFILDDIIGFVGDNYCKEFVVPYFTKIYGAFDARVKFLHNDAPGLVSAPYLPQIGVNLFNPSFEHDINQLKCITNNKVAILGNIPPRDVLAAKAPEEVYKHAVRSLKLCSDTTRLIMSCGGGMPPGVSTDNIRAFIAACQKS